MGRWPLSTPEALSGPAGSRQVGDRYDSNTGGRAPDPLGGTLPFKSRYERNYARFLNYLGIRWEYERRTFVFEKIQTGTRVYTPDFYLPDESAKVGHEVYHETKDYLDRRSRTQLSRIKRYYPEVQVVLIDSGFFREIERQRLCRLIADCECTHTGLWWRER